MTKKEKTLMLTESQVIAHKKQMYNKIMKEIQPILESAEEQAELNELFGFGNSVKEPERKLTAENIKEVSTEELSDMIAEHLNFWMAKAGDNIDKAVNAATTALFEHCKGGKEASKKVFQAIVIACRKAADYSIDLVKDSAKALGRIIMLGIAISIKFGANSIEFAKQAVSAIYKTVSEKLTAGYEAFKSAVERGVDFAEEKIQLFCKLSAAAVYLVANKFTGAVETLGDWVNTVINDVKEKVGAACLIVRTWFSMKSKAIAEWVKTTVISVKDACVAGFNALDKKIRQGWNKVADKVMSWINDIQCTMSKLADKVADTLTKVGDTIIAGKDKAILAGIGKAVKMLSNNYSEDDVVAIVRKAYNEGLSFTANGSCIINEAYYTNTRLKRI